MKEVKTIEAVADVKAQDPIGVLGGDHSDRRGGHDWPVDLGLKGSFEVAWDLAH